MEWKSVDYIQLPVVISPEILKNTISLVISPEIRKWVKIWFWGFFRDDDKSSKSHCNPEFFVSKGVFCSKLSFFAKKNWRKEFSETSRQKFVAYPPKFDDQKSHQILNIEIFDDMCLMCAHTINCLKWPWGTLELSFFVSRSYSTCGERYSTFYLGVGKKKVVKTGGGRLSTRFTTFVLKR